MAWSVETVENNRSYVGNDNKTFERVNTLNVPPNKEETTPEQIFLRGPSLSEICLSIFSSSPADVQPIGEGSNDCRAFKLRIGGKWIKCYECESPERALMVKQATCVLECNNVPIPQIYEVVEHVVFADWVKGKLLTDGGDRALITRMSAYQARIHQADTPSEITSGDRFIHLEWLLKRMRQLTRGFVQPGKVEALCKSIDNLIPPLLKVRIIQPDFIKSNIVKTPSGKLVIVDNEFLGIGLGFELDIVNASHVISGGDEFRRRQYLNAYAAVGDCGTLIQHGGFWDICYLTKLVGKRFLIGDVEMGKVCLDLLDYKVREYAS